MNSKLSPNVAVRRFPSGPSVADSLQSSRGVRLGSPYKALDGLSVLLLWAMYLTMGAVLIAAGSMASLPWFFVLGPASIALVCMLGKLVDRTWFLRTLTLIYLGCCWLGIHTVMAP